jgi:hypothetical protein
MRHAVRSVFKQPLFSLIVIGTLALGIGLNVALFGIFNAMLFRPLPVQDPGRLVAILSSSTRADGRLPLVVKSALHLSKAAGRVLMQQARDQRLIGQTLGEGPLLDRPSRSLLDRRIFRRRSLRNVAFA